MFTYTCHPVVEKMLSEDPELSIFRNSNCEIHFVTTYLPTHKNSLHGWLDDTVRFRLSNPQTPVVILSFPGFEFTRKYDIHGILELKGTFFLRLPYNRVQLLAVMSKSILTTEILYSSWKSFIISICSSQLKEGIGKLRHGGSLAIGNTIIYPLRSACVAFPQNPVVYTEIISSKLMQLRELLTKKELNRMLFFSDKAKNVSNDFLDKGAELIPLLNDISENVGKNEIKPEEILVKVDRFILLFNTLIET